MKRQMVIGPLLVAAMASGVYCETASASRGRAARQEAPCDCREDGGAPGGGRFPERMARELKLTEAQKAQVRAIFAEEREQTRPLQEMLEQGRRQLHEATMAATFDEAAVRAIAAGQAEARTELMVSHARTRSRINAILTPEQRTAAEKMAPDRRRGKRPLPPEIP